jgi:hypothetical protein
MLIPISRLFRLHQKSLQTLQTKEAKRDRKLRKADLKESRKLLEDAAIAQTQVAKYDGLLQSTLSAKDLSQWSPEALALIIADIDAKLLKDYVEFKDLDLEWAAVKDFHTFLELAFVNEFLPVAISEDVPPFSSESSVSKKPVPEATIALKLETLVRIGFLLFYVFRDLMGVHTLLKILNSSPCSSYLQEFGQKSLSKKLWAYYENLSLFQLDNWNDQSRILDGVLSYHHQKGKMNAIPYFQALEDELSRIRKESVVAHVQDQLIPILSESGCTELQNLTLRLEACQGIIRTDLSFLSTTPKAPTSSSKGKVPVYDRPAPESPLDLSNVGLVDLATEHWLLTRPI